ncbi:MAG: branched-chain amino acid ABC transporter substrate-binding protein [Chloroflexi bacterium]|nr:branched-chain amino acid ABC transporter substrate-binding protein [Chloroflexota bacterium]
MVVDTEGRMRRFKFLGLVLAVLALVALACGEEKPAATATPTTKETPKAAFSPPTDSIGVLKVGPNEPIRIASALVISGADANLGTDSQRGIEIAIDDRKEIKGHSIQLRAEDDGCSAEGGQAVGTKLAADPAIVAVIGTSCSSAARAAAPLVVKAGKAMVSPSNTAPFLTDANRGADFAGYLRTAHNDKVQGAVAAKFVIEQLKVKKAATIHDGSPYADQLQAVFAAEFKKLGGEITAQEAVAPTDTDMRPVLTKIAAGKPELIYYPIFVAAGGHVTSQARSVSGLEQVKLMSADGTFAVDFLKAAGDAAVGVYHSSPDFSAFAAGYANFKTKHKAKYGEDPISAFHAHAYDAATIVFNAIEKVAVEGPDKTLYIPQKALRDALFATKDHQGVTGRLTCDQNGDCADPKIAVYQNSADNVKQAKLPDTPVWKPF